MAMPVKIIEGSVKNLISGNGHVATSSKAFMMGSFSGGREMAFHISGNSESIKNWYTESSFANRRHAVMMMAQKRTWPLS